MFSFLLVIREIIQGTYYTSSDYFVQKDKLPDQIIKTKVTLTPVYPVSVSPSPKQTMVISSSKQIIPGKFNLVM
jgi:hypothetical protein